MSKIIPLSPMHCLFLYSVTQLYILEGKFLLLRKDIINKILNTSELMDFYYLIRREKNGIVPTDASLKTYLYKRFLDVIDDMKEILIESDGKYSLNLKYLSKFPLEDKRKRNSFEKNNPYVIHFNNLLHEQLSSKNKSFKGSQALNPRPYFHDSTLLTCPECESEIPFAYRIIYPSIVKDIKKIVKELDILIDNDPKEAKKQLSTLRKLVKRI